MQQIFSTKKTAMAIAIGLALTLGACGGDDEPGTPSGLTTTQNAWMTSAIIAEMDAAKAKGDAEWEAVANKRAKLLIAQMTLEQKLQQLTGSVPEIVPELPECKGARHVSSIAALNIPTFRITNGPVGLGQNDCVSAAIKPIMYPLPTGETIDVSAYTDPTSAKATALPSAMAAAASFDPAVAGAFGDVIATEMLNLSLHEFEAPGMNLARLPILGRNFEYFGEDPFVAGTMSVAEIKAIQNKGLIAMSKHYVANEQETNRMTIQTTVDRQLLRELYLLPFEMSVKDGKVGSIMCAYNYVNSQPSCENKEILTDVLRNDWGFTGYVQSDFFATKTTVGPMQAGMDFMMPTPQQWSAARLSTALAAGTITLTQVDKALERRYTQMFKYGIFDRPIKQTPIDFAGNGQKARDIGTKAAVLLQNNGALPVAAASVKSIVIVGKASQVYAQSAVAGGQTLGKPMGAGGGSSDVVPNYTVAPLEGIKAALAAAGNTSATVKLILVDDANTSATIDGVAATLAQAQAAAAGAESVIIMAGTISEEGADRATFTSTAGTQLDGSAATGNTLDWYTSGPVSKIATTALAKNSGTVDMIKGIMGLTSTTAKTMTQKTALVLKDNAGVAMDPALVGANGPAILETWFPGQEDGNIVADLVFGKVNPSGKLPVTMPFVGQGFLDNLAADQTQFPGKLLSDNATNVVEYSEGLNIGYRWYDANDKTPAFPFGHGLSYTTFDVGSPTVAKNGSKYDVKVTVKNTGAKTGSEVVQVYVGLPAAPGYKQPPKRLVGFSKVELAAGASKEVTLTIDPAASNHPLSYWNTNTNLWTTPKGTFKVYVGNSSRNVQETSFAN